jgi:hypothetical protein
MAVVGVVDVDTFRQRACPLANPAAVATEGVILALLLRDPDLELTCGYPCTCLAAPSARTIRSPRREGIGGIRLRRA